jgi:hypothetical protein
MNDELALQTMIDFVHGNGEFTVTTSVTGQGFEIHNSEGEWIENFKTSLDVETAFL